MNGSLTPPTEIFCIFFLAKHLCEVVKFQSKFQKKDAIFFQLAILCEFSPKKLIQGVQFGGYRGETNSHKARPASTVLEGNFPGVANSGG